MFYFGGDACGMVSSVEEYLDRLNYISIYTACFDPIFGRYKVLHIKHLEEEYYCAINMSELKSDFNFLQVSFRLKSHVQPIGA